MAVLVDTSVWSLAFRRNEGNLSETEQRLLTRLNSLIEAQQAVLPGVARMELLAGLREPERFERLQSLLRAFPDPALTREDYETAANFNNRCKTAGIAATDIDMLLCALAARLEMKILTRDRDFERYAPVLRVRLLQ